MKYILIAIALFTQIAAYAQNTVVRSTDGVIVNAIPLVAVGDATLSGDGTTASPLKLASQGAAPTQGLQYNGTTWLPYTYPTISPDGVVNRVAFYSGPRVLTHSANLTFNGSGIGVGVASAITSLDLNGNINTRYGGFVAPDANTWVTLGNIGATLSASYSGSLFGTLGTTNTTIGRPFGTTVLQNNGGNGFSLVTGTTERVNFGFDGTYRFNNLSGTGNRLGTLSPNGSLTAIDQTGILPGQLLRFNGTDWLPYSTYNTLFNLGSSTVSTATPTDLASVVSSDAGNYLLSYTISVYNVFTSGVQTTARFWITDTANAPILSCATAWNAPAGTSDSYAGTVTFTRLVSLSAAQTIKLRCAAATGSFRIEDSGGAIGNSHIQLTRVN